MSRIFWMSVGAAGGIYGYRKATDIAAGVKSRTFRENVGQAARTATNVAASARYFAALSSQDQVDETLVAVEPVVDLRSKRSRLRVVSRNTHTA